MKKIILCVLCIALSLMTVALCACEKEPVRQGQRSSSSYQKSSGYSFPYLTDSTGSSSSVSRPFAGTSSEEVSAPPIDTGLGVAYLIVNIGEVTKENYLEKEELILYITEKLADLSQEEQLKVYNLQVLLEAANTFDAYLFMDMAPIVDNFISLVDSIDSFEYSDEFKQKLDDASEVYSTIHEFYLEVVENEKTVLDGYYEKYNDHDLANTVTELIESLPSEINDLNVGRFKYAISEYDSLTEYQKTLIKTSDILKIIEFSEVIDEKYSTEYLFTFDSLNEMFSVNNAKIVSGNFSFENVSTEKAAICTNDSSIALTSPYGGNLSIYLANSSEKINLVVSKGSNQIAKVSCADNSIVNISLVELGNYSITFEGTGQTTVYAIAFK